MSKYQALGAYLRSQYRDRVALTFEEIERILGIKLPPSAGQRAWWSNNPTNNVATREWLEAGFKTEQVNVEGRTLVFRRIEQRAEEHGGRVAVKDVSAPPATQHHPLVGGLKGLARVAPGADLTAPADPEWADRG